ncbi:hypothetical protein VTL71DRAFT_2556 [Oculimacula yallundae]|uniref:Uncharacterized protein n=1 Tax=Oculimacula yallundae TaxID=86028 RepID=A0ABR4C9A2_9HELO
MALTYTESAAIGISLVIGSLFFIFQGIVMVNECIGRSRARAVAAAATPRIVVIPLMPIEPPAAAVLAWRQSLPDRFPLARLPRTPVDDEEAMIEGSSSYVFATARQGRTNFSILYFLPSEQFQLAIASPQLSSTSLISRS